MKEWIFGGIGLLIGLVGGFAAGYFARKHGEIEIEEVTEEELNELAGIKPEEKHVEEVKADVTIEAKDIQKAIDTQKTKYWNMWKDGQDYLKQSELKDGEDPVISEDETYDIPDDDLGEDNEDEEKEEDKIELTSEEEYNYWRSFKDGEYETSDIVWFSGDDVTLDDDTLPIVNPLRHLGFLPKRIFDQNPGKEELFVKNNFYKIVFCVSRIDQTYDTKRHEEEYGGDDE